MSSAIPDAADPQRPASDDEASSPGRPEEGLLAVLRIGRAEKIAAAATAAWLLLALLFRLLAGGGDSPPAAERAMAWVALLLPVAMIWLAALIARASRELRAEAAQLAHLVELLRRNAEEGAFGGAEPAPARAAAAAQPAEPAAVRFTSRREPPAMPRRLPPPPTTAAPAEEQAALALGTPPEALQAPVEAADFIRALNFPDDAEDAEGFRALRHALQDRRMAKLIRAAQDVLTLLAQDGIYMDDLAPDRARPEVWRRFAGGERGREIAALGGIRDRSSLALSAGRMRQDAIFRDAAHHFLRQFDQSFAELEKTASDVEIAELAGTRTARAFMLLGRVTGIFD